MTDIVFRLRQWENCGINEVIQLRKDAANEIERLRRERDDYRDMLKGIAININNMLKPIGNASDGEE